MMLNPLKFQNMFLRSHPYMCYSSKNMTKNHLSKNQNKNRHNLLNIQNYNHLHMNNHRRNSKYLRMSLRNHHYKRPHIHRIYRKKSKC